MIELAGDYGDGLINRGVATWLDPTSREREALPPANFRSHARRAPDRARRRDRRSLHGLRQPRTNQPARRRALHSRAYHMTSPPAVIDDIVVVGSAIDDNSRVDMPSGVVRAFRCAHRRAALEMGTAAAERSRAPPRRASGKIWRTGAGNAWSVMVVDPERDLIFVPTGSASPDYYGGMRAGDDKWADSIVALRAKTGELVWGFQLVHHDLWDYDSASPPLLATLQHDGKERAGGDSRQQDRFSLRAESRYWRAGYFPWKNVRAAIRCAGRSHVANAAFSAGAAGSGAAKAFRRRRLGHHSGRSRLLPRAHQEPAQRRPLHAAEFARLALRTWKCRRDELERLRVRSATQLAAGQYE